MENRISKISRFLLIVSAVFLIVSIFVPIWKIELDAPQYPEGLELKIYSHKLGGQVEIINGLNHYIGMQTLHADNFIEFTLLPYIIGFYALLIFATALAGRKKLLYFSFFAFVLFGIVAMVDFWRWEYNYGHNLDPNAAIIVPGMAYQPPLIGFKQLLNFGAYSIPDWGGWLFVACGILLLISVIYEYRYRGSKSRKITNLSASVVLFLTLLLSACNSSEPVPIKLNHDKCDYCEMTISDGRFGAEILTKKGRVYKFDDLYCLTGYKRENSKIEFAHYFVHDYEKPNHLIDASKAFYIKSDSIKSPMGGNIAAFVAMENANTFGKSINESVKSWEEILKP